MKHTTKKGFTLLEILLVIALLAILFATVLYALNPSRIISEANDNERKADALTIYQALEQYALKTGSHHPQISALTANSTTPICKTPGAGCIDITFLVPTYIQSIPFYGTDPVLSGFSIVTDDIGRFTISGVNSVDNTIFTRGQSIYTNIVCPTGYIKVPGNSLYNTEDFCVMKYEAKAVAIASPTVGLTTPDEGANTIDNTITATTSANGRAVASVASGYPIVKISQITAATYCINAGGSLITNKEWMTIARNIEAQPSNWTGGTVGSGGLWRGHSDNTPALGLVAGIDTAPYSGTGDISPSIQKRTHTLSNGSVIWDLSGNVWEWTNNTITGADQPTITASPGFGGWRPFTLLTTNGILNYDDYRASNTSWDTSQNVGAVWSDGTPGNNTIYGFIRGSQLSDHSFTGVFSLNMSYIPSDFNSRIGFRCVNRGIQTPPLGFTGFNSSTQSIIQQSDGKLVIGGFFTTYQGVSVNKITRLNNDGTRDSSFNIGVGFNNPPASIIQQSDGKIVLGGDFTTYQGVAANYIIRLNSDGSRDNTFNIGTGFNSSVMSIIQQSDGKIVIGGFFTTYQGVSANGIIRLNADGSIDTSFNIGTGFNGTVNKVYQQSDGKIIIGGSFSTYQGVSTNRITRLNSNGSQDNTFNIGTGFNNVPYAVIQQSDGKLVLGGTFTTYQGAGANYIIRLNSDGSPDNTFAIGTGFNNLLIVPVRGIIQQSDGKLIIGGDFGTYQGVGANYIIRLNSNGSRDYSFSIGTGFDQMVYSIITQNDGKFVVGGSFTQYQGVAAQYIARLNTDGSRAQ
jgi:uncharacterized delta-60 repeat protein/prepilin-type N-terminal cleavage/methylation domain-containing protein